MTMQQTADRDAPSQELGFTLLEARIAGLPDGPVSMYATPPGIASRLLRLIDGDGASRAAEPTP
ncbi:hypothetical protein [Xanthomonas sp. XNM01]|uniref:hypothetical protein n=1 Tax=Xanthomonas sp. XNM01 TaxID=2769289 RepID=UPI00177FA918|nr:hypothetical protein [Xanthomonas sp. XNM01]MBD9369769.1 hypothetical protein [Xanthomonas sp. XNM01]